MPLDNAYQVRSYMVLWWNWYTQQIQILPLIGCEFESHQNYLGTYSNYTKDSIIWVRVPFSRQNCEIAESVYATILE